MDITQIEQALTFIQNQGSGTFEHLADILQAITNGVLSISAISAFVAKWPTLGEVMNQLVVLISSGASIPEIATALAEFASIVGLPIEALANFLYMLGGLLVLF